MEAGVPLTRSALDIGVSNEARQALAEHGALRQAVDHATLGVQAARLDGAARVHALVLHAGLARRALGVRLTLVRRVVRHCGTGWRRALGRGTDGANDR